MSKLNKDVLYIIFEELYFDINHKSLTKTKKSLHSCLLINKLWCEIAVLILWRNPWKFVPGMPAEIFLLRQLTQ